MFAERIVQRELARLDELQGGDRGEHGSRNRAAMVATRLGFIDLSLMSASGYPGDGTSVVVWGVQRAALSRSSSISFQ